MTEFWLGAHMPQWLDGRVGPVMVSRRRLDGRRLPRAATEWVLDSGGFTELSMHGEWKVPAHLYIAFVRRAYDEIGMMRWAAPQDWMCEPFMLEKTGKTVAEHQALTVDNYLALRTYAPDLQVIPVLQGWTRDDYLRCVDLYGKRGVDVTAETIVGLGSVCRRQATDEIGLIVSELHALGIALHGFGCKLEALRKYGTWLASADSMAWSFNGRKIRPCPVRGVASCANCAHHALTWKAGMTCGHRPLQGTLL